ncbi:MAG: chemotaxis protein CheA [Synergistaceae bacterium]|nr:chemotaxis protein CheA [Synergistaceae bacterium]
MDVEALNGDPKLMNGAFRSAHSLKGTAGFFSLEKIVAVAHELESVFSQIKDGTLALNDEISDIVLQSVDCLRDLVDNIGGDEAVDIGKLVKTLKNYSNAGSREENTKEEIHTPFDRGGFETEKALKNAARRGHKIYYVNIGFNRSLGKYYKNPKGMIDNILSIGSIVAAIVDGNPDETITDLDTEALTLRIADALAKRDTSTLELLVTSVLEFDLFSIAIEVDKKHIRLLKEGCGSEPAAIGEESEWVYKKAPARENNFSIRLDISVINGLLDLANEMILTRNQLFSAVSRHKRSIAGLAPVLHDMARLTSEIQEKVMLTRMQPISVIFDKFSRMIRDTAKALNKEIELETFGGDVMLDKYLLDSLADPITQLVKNAACHGLEPAERRVTLGKPQKGKITLNAYMRDGLAFIEVTDDGAGIDAEALKRKSLELGAATEERLSAMSRSDIFALMFEPGITTAEQVTRLSGRGVGMDIVKTNIEKLGGSIEVDSEQDKGTTVRLKMPLTLSVIRTLIVEIDSVRYSVPEVNVERIVRIRHGMPLNMTKARIERLNDSLVLSLGGRVIPIVTMREIDARAKGLELPPDGSPFEQILRRDVAKCLVLKARDKNFALLIDDAVKTEQTLVKPLPGYLRKCLCYSSVTVLGNGSAIAILDAEGILRLMGIEGVEKNALTQKDEKDEKQIIIFKCSGAEYFALEMDEISRIEAVGPERIQRIGDGRFVNIAGKTVRVVRPENFAPVHKRRYTGNKLYVLTLKKSAPPVGLLAGKVLDKVSGGFELDHDRLYSDFIFGTSVFNEKILIFLDPSAIAEEVEKDKQKRKAIKRI